MSFRERINWSQDFPSPGVTRTQEQHIRTNRDHISKKRKGACPLCQAHFIIIHSLSLKAFIEHLLSTEHCARQWAMDPSNPWTAFPGAYSQHSWKEPVHPQFPFSHLQPHLAPESIAWEKTRVHKEQKRDPPVTFLIPSQIKNIPCSKELNILSVTWVAGDHRQ